MLSPDASLILWQILILLQLVGMIYSLVLLYKHITTFSVKTAWCFLIVCIPLTWIIYLILRKQESSSLIDR